MTPLLYEPEEYSSTRTREFDPSEHSDELHQVQNELVHPVADSILDVITETISDPYFSGQDFLENLRKKPLIMDKNICQIDQWHTEQGPYRRDLVFGLLVVNQKGFRELFPDISKDICKNDLFTRREDWHWKNGPIQAVPRHGIMITIPMCMGPSKYIADAYEPLYGSLSSKYASLRNTKTSGQVLKLFDSLHFLEHGIANSNTTAEKYNILPQAKLDGTIEVKI